MLLCIAPRKGSPLLVGSQNRGEKLVLARGLQQTLEWAILVSRLKICNRCAFSAKRREDYVSADLHFRLHATFRFRRFFLQVCSSARRRCRCSWHATVLKEAQEGLTWRNGSDKRIIFLYKNGNNTNKWQLFGCRPHREPQDFGLAPDLI